MLTQLRCNQLTVLSAYGPEGKSLLQEFWMIQSAEQLLEQLGYRKTLFNHYARANDTNLYFTFPERGEDCLALGAIADGVFGSYHYRHPEYRPYLQQVSDGFPALQGGLRRSPVETRLFPLETAILSATLQKSQFTQVLGETDGSELFAAWSGSNLIEQDGADEECFHLTAGGSWFAGSMMQQLAQRIMPSCQA